MTGKTEPELALIGMRCNPQSSFFRSAFFAAAAPVWIPSHAIGDIYGVERNGQMTKCQRSGLGKRLAKCRKSRASICNFGCR